MSMKCVRPYAGLGVGPDEVIRNYGTRIDEPVVSRPSFSLAALMAAQQFLVTAGMAVAAILARRTPWGRTYRRLALGLLVQLITLSLSEAGILQGIYRTGFVFDFVWIVPLETVGVLHTLGVVASVATTLSDPPVMDSPDGTDICTHPSVSLLVLVFVTVTV